MVDGLTGLEERRGREVGKTQKRQERGGRGIFDGGGSSLGRDTGKRDGGNVEGG